MRDGLLRACATYAVLICAVAGAPSVQAITGTISGDGSDYLVTDGCGSDSSFGSFKITLRAGRKWRMVDDFGAVYSGSFTADSPQRNIVLSLDSSSEDRLVNALKQWGTNLCGASVKVKSHSKPVVKIRFSADFKVANGRLVMTATGKTRFGTGSARYTAQFTGATFSGRQ